MHFYQRLRDVREDRDLKQADIAKVLQITCQQYQLYESGKREIPVHHLITLAKYYHLPTDYLLGLIQSPHAVI